MADRARVLEWVAAYEDAWCTPGVGALADERQKLAELIQADSDLQGHHQ